MVEIARHCRGCCADGLELILDLGPMPLANALLADAPGDGPEPMYPLSLAYCPRCTLAQIRATAPPGQQVAARPNGASDSDALLRDARAVAERMMRERRLTAESLVVEVGSRDGSLLENYREVGITVLGIEPERDIAAISEERGVSVLCDAFGEELAEELASAWRQADVIHAHDVLDRAADVNGFARGVARLLKPDGVAVFKVPYVRDMVERREFDAIQHDTFCYFSLTALDAMFRRSGLVLADVERIPAHGGSLRLVARRANAPDTTQGAAVYALLAEERALRMHRPEYYHGFAKRVDCVRADLTALLRGLRAEGKRIAAYGAGPRGATLLNYCGIGRETIEYVADDCEARQGCFVPGAHVPIVPPSHLNDQRPDYLLLLDWNGAGGIIEQQADYRQAGGRFVLPLPEVAVL